MYARPPLPGCSIGPDGDERKAGTTGPVMRVKQDGKVYYPAMTFSHVPICGYRLVSPLCLHAPAGTSLLQLPPSASHLVIAARASSAMPNATACPGGPTPRTSSSATKRTLGASIMLKPRSSSALRPSLPSAPSMHPPAYAQAPTVRYWMGHSPSWTKRAAMSRN